MLDAGEIKRRIEAARILRSLTQDELDKLGAAFGLDRQEISRTERGALPLTEHRKLALREILRMPARWFDAETVDEIVGLDAEREADALGHLQRLLEDAGLMRRPSQEESPEDGDGKDRPGQASGGAGT